MFFFGSSAPSLKPKNQGFEPVSQEDIELGIGNRVSVAEALRNAKLNTRVHHHTDNENNDTVERNHNLVPAGGSPSSSSFSFGGIRSMLPTSLASYIPSNASSTLPSNLDNEPPRPTTFLGRAKYAVSRSFSRALTAILSFFSFPELTYVQRMIGCFMFAIAGALMLFLCFMSLPSVLLGRAAKFVLDYLLASFFFFVASLFIIPLSDQLRTLSSPGKRLGSVVYISATVLLILACQSTFTRSAIVILPLFLVHLICLTYHLAGFIPFGTSALSGISGLASTLAFSSR